MDIILFILILILACKTGSFIEKSHFKKIKKREMILIKKPYFNFGCKNFKTAKPVKNVYLVTGEAVISVDYFKNFVSGLRKTIGGRLTSVESVMDRARREALLRMREKAAADNVDIILNVKYETAMLNDYFIQSKAPVCSVIVYGTAVKYE